MENRENPIYNQSHMITTLEFNGNVQGRMLLDYGFDRNEIPDELRDYAIQAWLIGQYLIKVQLSPNVRRRKPFYITQLRESARLAGRQRHPRSDLRPAGSVQRLACARWSTTCRSARAHRS